jgi:L-xylulose reductase
MSHTFTFTGKRAVVTGAGKGIGNSLVKALHKAGAHVHAISRTQADLDALKSELGPERLTLAQADLGDVAQTTAAMEAAGDVDFLVNNAGIALNGPFLEQTPENFATTMSVNVTAAFVCTQIAGRNMKSRGSGGVIVNVSSQASLLALPEHTGYCTSKAALDMLTKMTALELGPFGIRCNAVNPTVVLTAMGKANWSDPAKAQPMLNKIPLGRFAEVEDVVDPILFLLSDASAMLNGSVMPIEGGFASTATLK